MIVTQLKLEDFFSIIKSFLMKFVINGHTFEGYEINADVSRGSLLGPIIFLLCIKVLPKKIFISRVNIYTDDTSMYGYTFKNLDGHREVTDLSPDLVVTAQ